MRAALLLNAAAGRLSRLDAPRGAIEATMAQAGFEILAVPGGDLDAQWDAARAGGAELVFIAGGDGTLRGFARRLMDTRLPCAPLPGGTMNRICARLGLPPEPLDAATWYRPGPFMALDAATLNDEVLLYQSVVGSPARLLRFREMQRGEGWRGWLPLALAALRTLLRDPRRDVVVPIGQNSRASGVAAIITLPEPDSSAALTLQVLRPSHSIARLRQLWRWFHGRLAEDPGVLTLVGERLLVHGRGRLIRVSLDGELMALAPPLRVRLRRGAIILLRPTPA
ncbi:MAG TPA: diacylglycerol kinase family protein [Roseococcus sp.]|nr:diacylglycerol kinase family protein [Roseococcus sp.]